ncbi:MAG: LytTR family DNA-binding domain-containing protein [Chitinophagaceae bacterium]|nr:LytTR family DNA-binding domain-containing protein [Chitinophagaceae bacterium]
MKLQAIAIDDEPLALEVIKQYCRRQNDIRLLQAFDNAIVGLEYINLHPPDILFVDIDMPDMNGLDLVSRIQSKPIIIFTTAYKEFAVKGFDLEAVDYLLKPFSYERFEKAVRKATLYYKTRHDNAGSDHIFVYSEYRMVKIDLDNIIYIESLDDYIKIHLSTGKPVMTLMSLKKISADIPAGQFMRIHRSYIVSTSFISSLSGRKIILTNGTTLPVSERYSAQLLQWAKRS